MQGCGRLHGVDYNRYHVCTWQAIVVAAGLSQVERVRVSY